MEDIREVLDIKAQDIVPRLTCPDFMARVYLRRFLSNVECGKVDSQTKYSGDSMGAMTLLDLIKKKEPAVFEAFLDALREQALPDLADELQGVLRGIRRRQTERQRCEEIPKKLNPESGNPERMGAETLLRQIPEVIRQKIVSLMDSPSEHDWRVIAGHWGLSAEEVQGMEQGKTQTLLKKMSEQNLKVSHLLKFLLDAERYDVIDEMKMGGLVSDAELYNSTYRETAV